MKLKIYSQTGKPTNLEEAKAYETEFKAEYDKLWEAKQSGKITIDDMRLALDEVDKKLQSKYKMFIEVQMPKSGKQWKELIMNMEAPITIAITEENKELALFLMDSQY